MTNALTINRTYTLTFDLNHMAGEHNNYNKALDHPMGTEIRIVQLDGSVRSIMLGQLDTFLKYAADYPNMGKALDAVYKRPPVVTT